MEQLTVDSGQLTATQVRQAAVSAAVCAIVAAMETLPDMADRRWAVLSAAAMKGIKLKAEGDDTHAR